MSLQSGLKPGREKKRRRRPPLSVVEASDHHGVPQRIHLAAAVVHHSGEPGVHRLRAVAVTVTQQLLVDADGDEGTGQN